VPDPGLNLATAAQVSAHVRQKDIATRWLLSAPALLILAFAAVGPLFVMLLYSFLAKGDHGDVKYWQFTTDGWFSVFFQRDVFDDTVSIADAHLSILWRSVKLSLITTLLTLMIGFPTAYYISTQPPKRRDLLVFLITIPFWTNILIRTFAIQQVINNEGVINSLLHGLGLTASPIQIMYTDAAIFIGMLYVYLPLMVLPLYASMEKIDFRLVEAGYDLYAGRFQVLKRVIIPLVKPGIVAGCILVFIPSLGAFVAPALLGGGKNLMLATLIDLQFGKGSDWPLGAALSITLLVIVTFALLFYVRNESKAGGNHGR
jgi:spermidine/putrescine transport system permease protein